MLKQFEIIDRIVKKHYTVHLEHIDPDTEPILAKLLAENVMKSKFGGATHIIKAWETKKNKGFPPPPELIEAAKAAIDLAIGLPSSPKDENHIQGWVAEHLWSFLLKNSYRDNSVELIFEPGIS